ncbi:MAG: hypothetical protein J6Y89_11575 [Lachnospiraceae bacterium]|nr:hypothetical protein [Lachnospiraceae bacterium]
MKTRIQSITKLLLAAVLCCAMFFSLVPATQASAAKMTNKNAQKILKKKVKNTFCKYAFVDIDKDKIDEMIVLSFNGKFTESGDDEIKSLTVYKVSGKKAKSVLNYSINGDPYFPTLSFDLFYNDASYITVNEEHEGYAHYVTYQFKSGKYKEVSRIVEYIAETEVEYYIGKKEVSEEKYLDFMKDIIENEVELKYQSCSAKIANEYVHKMLTAYFERTYAVEEIPIEHTSPIFRDWDEDGIDEELVVRVGPQNVITYTAIPMEGNICGYSVDEVAFTLNAGGPFDEYDDDGPKQ